MPRTPPHPTAPAAVKPRRRPLALLFAPPLALLALSLHLLPSRAPFPSPSPAPARASRTPSDRCHIIGHDAANRAAYPVNARALCLAATLCLRPSPPALLRPSLPPPRCALLRPAWRPHAPQAASRAVRAHGGCAGLRRALVSCAFGAGLRSNLPRCPEEGLLESTGGGADGVVWKEDVTIFVPSYPFPANIYHYATVAAWLVQAIRGTPWLLQDWGVENVRDAHNNPYFPSNNPASPRAINVLFAGPRPRNLWQQGLLTALLNDPNLPAPVTTSYLSETPLPPDGLLCARNAVMLGLRGHVNVWPFPNSTALRTDGSRLPVDALAFKDAIYHAAALPSVDVATAPYPARPRAGERRVLRPPPPVLGYARRLGARDAAAAGSNVRTAGTARRFSDADERWFRTMLAEEAGRRGVRLQIFTMRADDAFLHQVRRFEGVGFLVGIHGANLVNGLFMRPLGGLLELFPRGVRSTCYVAGANSGLAYWGFEPSRFAPEGGNGTREAPECDRRDISCGARFRHRGVDVGAKEDRIRVRGLVQEGISYLVEMRRRFPSGVPVVFEEESGEFVVDGHGT